jgi:hypothetical protein
VLAGMIGAQFLDCTISDGGIGLALVEFQDRREGDGLEITSACALRNGYEISENRDG